jgi:hypothetical protein
VALGLGVLAARSSRGRLNVQRAGQDMTLLDGLRMAGSALPAHGVRSASTDVEFDDDEQEEVAVNGSSPLALARRR